MGDNICRALGRPCQPLPDDLHVAGILHHLGMHARLDYLSDTNRFAGCARSDDFLAKVHELVGKLSANDVGSLRDCFDDHRDRIRLETMHWAFISWDVQASG